MDRLKEICDELPGQDLHFLAGTPYVYHCHHFNLFHDQTVEDALGTEASFQLRSCAAQSATYHLLSEVTRRQGAVTPAERLELAATLFAWMGQGHLELLGTAQGGRSRGSHLHYSLAWHEKYGTKVRRHQPVDAFAAGFAAAATEVAFGLPAGSLSARETSCFACRQPGCELELSANEVPATCPPIVDRDAVAQQVGSILTGQEEARITQIAAGLKEFVAGVHGDDRGLIQGFGLFITRHLASYYNETAYETIHQLEQRNPGLVPVLEALFGESGHVCVFYTFGNILLSPEWEGLVGPIRGEVEEVVSSCTAIARALGFGHWTIEELVPQKRLVLRCSSNYEAPFYRHRYGQSQRPRCYFFANAARAFMQLAHRVDWPARPELNEALYTNLFKTGLGWHIEQTRCLTRGDGYGEVVVTAQPGS